METTTLTRDELISRAREHDRTHNDGGDGYNPYRDELDRRETAEPAIRGKAEILRELSALDNSVARESGTYDQAKVDALKAELDELEQTEADAFAAEWTRDVTIARREAWNDRVRSGEFAHPSRPGKLSTDLIHRAWHEQGWTTDDLKRAVKLHGLD